MCKEQVMKYGLIILFALVSVTSIAQTDSSKWALSCHYNSGFAYRNLVIANDNLSPLKESLDEIEKRKFAQGVQFGLSRKITEKLSWSTGLGYQQFGHQMDSLDGVTLIKQTLGFIQIPLSIRYQFLGESKISPYISGGMQYGFLISDRLQYKLTSANRLFEERNTGQWNKNLLSAQAAVGIHFHVYPKNILCVGLVGQYGINTVTKSELQRHVYGWGIQMGWSMGL